MKSNHSTCDEESIAHIINRFDQFCTSSITPQKRKTKLSKIVLIACVATFSITSTLAATGIIDVSHLIKITYEKIFPTSQMAEIATTVAQAPNSSSTYNGMKTEVLSYLRDNDMFYMIFSIQDLEADRLDKTTYIYNYTTTFSSNYPSHDFTSPINSTHYGTKLNVISPTLDNIKLIDYDSATKTATFALCEYFTNEYTSTKIDSSRTSAKYFDLSMYQLASGMTQNEAFLDISSLLNDKFVSTMPFPDNSTYASNSDLPCLTPDILSIPFEHVEGSFISNVGIIDNELCILIKSQYSPTNINRILDITQKNTDHLWSAGDFYLINDPKTGELKDAYKLKRSFIINDCYYDEYRFTLPKNPTSEDFQLAYTYRTYDHITALAPISKDTASAFNLTFNIESSLTEVMIPFKVIDGESSFTPEAILSPIGLMCYDLTIPYGSYKNKDIPLTFLMKDGTKKEILVYDFNIIHFNNGADKTKLLFKEFIDINEVKEIILYLP